MQLLQLRKQNLKKIQACAGFQPLTFELVQCSTVYWANKPTGSRSLSWLVINPWKDDNEIMNKWNKIYIELKDSHTVQSKKNNSTHLCRITFTQYSDVNFKVALYSKNDKGFIDFPPAIANDGLVKRYTPYKELVALLRELNLDLTLLWQIIYYTNQWVDSLCINIWRFNFVLSCRRSPCCKNSFNCKSMR